MKIRSKEELWHVIVNLREKLVYDKVDEMIFIFLINKMDEMIQET